MNVVIRERASRDEQARYRFSHPSIYFFTQKRWEGGAGGQKEGGGAVGAVFRIRTYSFDPAFRLNTDPDPGFDDQKLEKSSAEKIPIGLHKELSSYRRSPQPSAENFHNFKT
jgi:hypothetical protein